MNEIDEPIPEIPMNPEPEVIETIEPPAQRGRGRPKKAAPSLEAEDVSQASNTKKRATGGKKQTFSSEAKSALAKQLQGIHHIAAHATGLGELMLSDPEAVLLADAITNLAAEYDLQLSGKTGAALQLLGTAAMIYYPRFLAVQQRARAAKATVVNPEANNG